MTFEHDPRLPDSLAAEGLGGPATAAVHLCRQGDARRPWLVWIHGAGQGQPLDLLFSRARRIQSELGFNIARPVQPGHGVRRNAWPAYPNMDPLNNVAGMMRAVSEVRAVVRWLRPQASTIAVSGVSMGSFVAGLVSHLEKVDAVAVYTPIFGLNAMIAAHLGRWGPSVQDTIELVVRHRGASDRPSTTSPSSCRLCRASAHRALYDWMACGEPALALHELGRPVVWHQGSHVFSRRVQSVSERLLWGLTAEGGRRLCV
jgi:pimeloyl-ACP methyl ester carboxylesterase